MFQVYFTVEENAEMPGNYRLMMDYEYQEIKADINHRHLTI
jgi:hypothetical protein